MNVNVNNKMLGVLIKRGGEVSCFALEGSLADARGEWTSSKGESQATPSRGACSVHSEFVIVFRNNSF